MLVDYLGIKRKGPAETRPFTHRKAKTIFSSILITKPFVGSKTSYMVEFAEGQTIFSWILVMAYNNA